MLAYSGHDLFDLGQYEACLRELPSADYALMTVNISDLIGTCRIGMCLPKSCNQSHFDIFSKSATQMLNVAIQAYAKFGMSTKERKEWLGEKSLLRESSRVEV